MFYPILSDSIPPSSFSQSWCNCRVFLLQRPARCWLQPVGSSIQSCSVHSLSLVELATLRPWPLRQSRILPIFSQIAESCSARRIHWLVIPRGLELEKAKNSQRLQLLCCNVHFLASSHIPVGRQESRTLTWSTRDKSEFMESPERRQALLEP